MGRLVFHQPLRQTEELLGSLLDLMAIDLPFRFCQVLGPVAYQASV
jgi:hypothetical protein